MKVLQVPAQRERSVFEKWRTVPGVLETLMPGGDGWDVNERGMVALDGTIVLPARLETRKELGERGRIIFLFNVHQRVAIRLPLCT